MNRIKKSLILLKNGEGIKSKIIIFLFLVANFLKLKNYKKFLFSPLKLSTKNGKFYVRKESPYDLWMGSEVSERSLEDALNLQEGVFIDVGANIGKYTIKMGNILKKSGKVISFEPEKENFKMLKLNVSLNRLKNVVLIKKALSNKKRKLKLYLAEENLGGHSLVERVGKKFELVEVEKLDNIVKKLKLKRVDLIKIDVEGAEAEVLEGGIKTLEKYHPKIVFEAWNRKYLKKCKKILDKFGYKIKKIDKENYLAI